MTLSQHCCSTTLFPNTAALHHSHYSTPLFPYSSPNLLHTTLPQHCSTRPFPNTSLYHSSPTLLYTTIPQYFSTPFPTLSDTTLPNAALHHSSPTPPYATLPQHCSKLSFPITSLHHASPTLLYTLHQHCSTARMPTLLYTNLFHRCST